MTRFMNGDAVEHPVVLTMPPGRYYWCQCGRTAEVPFCDGSHEGTGLEPLEFTVEEARSVALCSCGITQTPPFCDGSHATLDELEDTE